MKDEKKKKILKVVQVVYNVLSALFIAFVGVGLCLASCDNKEVKQEVAPNSMIYESKTRRNYTNQSGYTFFTDSDIVSSTFIFNCTINWASLNWSSVSNGDYWYVHPLSSDVMELPSWNRIDFYNYENTWNAYGSAYLISSPKITCEGKGTSQYVSTTKFISYRLEWGSTIIHYDIFLYDSTSNPQYLVRLGSSNTLGHYFLTKNSYVLGYLQPMSYVDSGYQQAFNNGYENGYDAGYDVGYEDGKDYGYMTGYTAGNQDGYDLGYSDGEVSGYAAGQHDAQYDTYNAFTLIGTAFTSMAGVLSIELFPNFSLGLLVFIPVILAIVFVVVKAIKG